MKSKLNAPRIVALTVAAALAGLALSPQVAESATRAIAKPLIARYGDIVAEKAQVCTSRIDAALIIVSPEGHLVVAPPLGCFGQ